AGWVGAGACSTMTRRPGGVVHVSIDGHDRGSFHLQSALRPDSERLMTSLAGEYELSLLSGDNDNDRERFTRLFGPAAALHFNQSPLDKLNFVRRAQERGRRVVMVGDGLNDAGALKQSDVGIAVVEE